MNWTQNGKYYNRGRRTDYLWALGLEGEGLGGWHFSLAEQDRKASQRKLNEVAGLEGREHI